MSPLEEETGKGKGHGRNHRREEPTSKPSWGDVAPVIIRDAIVASERLGGGLLFGSTRDGGALSLRVYGEGEPYTVYFNHHDDPETWLREFALDYNPDVK